MNSRLGAWQVVGEPRIDRSELGEVREREKRVRGGGERGGKGEREVDWGREGEERNQRGCETAREDGGREREGGRNGGRAGQGAEWGGEGETEEREAGREREREGERGAKAGG